MLRTIKILFLLLFLMPLQAHAEDHAEDIVADSQLTKATVYTNRAKLTREARVSIPKGDHIIVIEGLPQSIFVDSLRAKGNANGKVVLGAVTAKMVTQADLIQPKEKELNDKLLAVKDQKNLLNADKQALNAQKEFLENLGQKVVQKENNNIDKLELDPKAWKSASSSLYEQISDNLKQTLSINQRLRDLKKEAVRIQTELNQLKTGQKSSYSVSVPVEASSASTLDLSIEYQIPGVSWYPLYDARLATKKEELDLVLFGSVRQNTGEDWEDIQLTLSTVQPHRGAGQPDLPTMWVGFRPHSPSRKRAAMLDAAEFSVNEAAMQRLELARSSNKLEEDMLFASSPVAMRQAQINVEGFIV